MFTLTMPTLDTVLDVAAMMHHPIVTVNPIDNMVKFTLSSELDALLICECSITGKAEPFTFVWENSIDILRELGTSENKVVMEVEDTFITFKKGHIDLRIPRANNEPKDLAIPTLDNPIALRYMPLTKVTRNMSNALRGIYQTPTLSISNNRAYLVSPAVYIEMPCEFPNGTYSIDILLIAEKVCSRIFKDVHLLCFVEGEEASSIYVTDDAGSCIIRVPRSKIATSVIPKIVSGIVAGEPNFNLMLNDDVKPSKMLSSLPASLNVYGQYLYAQLSNASYAIQMLVGNVSDFKSDCNILIGYSFLQLVSSIYLHDKPIKVYKQGTNICFTNNDIHILIGGV